MREYFARAVLAVFLLTLGTGCVAQEKKVNATSAEMLSPVIKPVTPKKRSAPTEPLLTVKATVQAVDLAGRRLTLKDAKGSAFDLKVGEEVESLAQLKSGDDVLTRFYEWAAVEIKKAGSGKAAVARPSAATEEPAEESIGVVRAQMTVTAVVEEIDHSYTHVTIRQPDGRSVKIFVRRPSYLKGIAAGDLVSITYIEALAISVEKMRK